MMEFRLKISFKIRLSKSWSIKKNQPWTCEIKHKSCLVMFDLVIECFPPKDLYGLYYRGKHSEGANGVCKDWKDTQFTHLKHHQNFCRRITTRKQGVYCVSTVNDTVQTCPVSKCGEYFRSNINSRSKSADFRSELT